MPRTGKGSGENRGGPRQLPPGASSANRTDLNAKPRSAGTMEVPGQTYGDRAAQVRQQQAIPMAAPPALNAPTQRPTEPLTSGIPSGPGPGPEALGVTRASPDMMKLTDTALLTLSTMAELPNTTSQSRNLVRRLRASAPGG